VGPPRQAVLQGVVVDENLMLIRLPGDITFFHAPCCIRQALIDVLGFQVRVGFEDVVTGSPRGEQPEYHTNRHTLTSDTRLAAHDRRIKSDAIELRHL
jgi:hypothetical protein